MRMMKAIAALALTSLLGACGGGGNVAIGDGDGGGPTTKSPSISIALSNTTVTAGSPATATAKVVDGTGASVAGQVVNFRTAAGLGTFSAPSALTDSNGLASVALSPATTSTAGADTVVASATVSGTAVEASTGFQLTATTVSIDSFTSDLTSLGAYGQTNLTVVLDGAPASTPVSVALSSGCVSKGRASLTPTTVATSTGVATFTYRDLGCGATDINDQIQASVTGTALTSSLSIALTSPTVSSITFVSASASTIYLKGSGLNETSQVTFQVRDTAGSGLPNQRVLLEATTLTGGLTLDGGSAPITKVSDSLGNVLVRINSGTVPTPVRIKATLVDDVSVATVSSNLAIAVGLPSQLNFSLSQGTVNIEGYNIDGTTNTYSIIASDRLSNQVPDGTAINFIAEGGQVEAIKFTSLTAGLSRARANFISAEPRPLDGRITVLVYALGEESFLDKNGNNVFNVGEDFQDLGNIFLDRRFDNYYDNALDQFISLSISGSSSCRTGVSDLLDLNKSIPSITLNSSSLGADTCDTKWGKAYVRRATETVLSSSSAAPVWFSKPADYYTKSGNTCTRTDDTGTSPRGLIVGYEPGVVAPLRKTFYGVGRGALYKMPGTGSISFLVADANPIRLNPMAAGTTITVTGPDGLTLKVQGGSPVPSTHEAGFTTISYAGLSGTATLSISFTSPSGLTTTVGQVISTLQQPTAQDDLVLCP